jgi:hypothetical protein
MRVAAPPTVVSRRRLPSRPLSQRARGQADDDSARARVSAVTEERPAALLAHSRQRNIATLMTYVDEHDRGTRHLCGSRGRPPGSRLRGRAAVGPVQQIDVTANQEDRLSASRQRLVRPAVGEHGRRTPLLEPILGEGDLKRVQPVTSQTASVPRNHSTTSRLPRTLERRCRKRCATGSFPAAASLAAASCDGTFALRLAEAALSFDGVRVGQAAR